MMARPHRPPVEDEDDMFDFPDLPDSFSDQNQSSRTPSITHPPPSSTHNPSRRNLDSTIMGAGPNGIGVITKLNTKAKPSSITHGSIKLKNKAVARTWEDELDFEGGSLTLRRGKKIALKALKDMDMDEEEEEGEGDWRKLQARPTTASGSGMGMGLPSTRGIGFGMPIRKEMPEADALDDLGFDLDDDDELVLEKKGEPEKEVKAVGTIKKINFIRPPTSTVMPGPNALDELDIFDDIDFNEDEATIKAGADLKALLPPPHLRKARPSKVYEDVTEDMDQDPDFALPLNLTNLTLATRSSSVTTGRQPRTSIASNASDWNNSPTSSNSYGKKTDGWDSTPSKRFSETSATSLSDGLNSMAKRYDHSYGNVPAIPETPSSTQEDEDMEDGLVLPSKHFFKSTSKRELNSLLDRKRRPEYASPTRQSHGLHDLTLNSDGLEDGLVFEDPKAELSRKRLVKSKEARSQIPIPTRRSPGGKLGAGGRDSPSKPLPSSHAHVRERTQSTIGLSYRSHSTGNTAIASSSSTGAKLFSPTRPRSPTLLSPGPGKDFSKERERSRSGQAYIPMRIPVALPPKTPPRSGLRHQKSSSHLPSPSTSTGQSHGLVRKQSLSSLQNPPPQTTFSSVSSLQSLPEESAARINYASTSTSRLRDPTSASKAKTRPPLHGVFPTATSHANASQSHIPTSSNSSSTRSRLLHAQMKRRPYGDGTELEAIEDLEVDEAEREKEGSWPKSGSNRSRGSTRDRPSLRSLFSPEKKKSSGSATPRKNRENDVHAHAHGRGHVQGREKEKEGSWGRRKGKRAPLLIKNLGGVDKRKVVGEMTWNPAALRWEGNESALKDFDHVSTPSAARPALITHPDLPSAGNTSPTSGSHHTSAGTVRIVGNMQFDPKEMRWISLDPEDEVDPFEDMADDEDEDQGTIRVNGKIFRQQLELESQSGSSVRHVSGVSSIAPGVAVSEELRHECKAAEERHRREMRGWVGGTGGSWSRAEERREEKRLWEIRHLALA